MYKVTVKRYGYLRWDGHQLITKLVRMSYPQGTMTKAEMDKFAQDNADFMSSIKTLKSSMMVKPTDEEAAAGLSWTTFYFVENQVEANAVKEYFSTIMQNRINSIDPNCGLVIEATVTQE